VSTNLEHFKLITPCGIQNSGVTSLEKLTGREIAMRDVVTVLERHFSAIFERELTHPPHDMRVAKVVVHDGERVLLLKRTEDQGGFWQPVTGTIEATEDAITAARREVEEETGYSSEAIESLQLEQSFLIDPAFLKDKTRPLFAEETAFAVVADSNQPVRLDAEEHDEARWFTFEEAYEKIRWTDDREAIEQLQRRVSRP
jgi:lipoyl(octanoyl) transferase